MIDHSLFVRLGNPRSKPGELFFIIDPSSSQVKTFLFDKALKCLCVDWGCPIGPFRLGAGGRLGDRTNERRAESGGRASAGFPIPGGAADGEVFSKKAVKITSETVGVRRL